MSAAAAIAAPARSLIRPAVDQLLEAESVARVVRRRLIHDGATLAPEQAAAEIEVAIAHLVAARAELMAPAAAPSPALEPGP